MPLPLKHLWIIFVIASVHLTAKSIQPINPIVGDESFVWKYGHYPAPSEENLRVAAHLEYAEYLLRSKDISALPDDLKAKREHTLDLLHEYWSRGIFPRNDDYMTERRPCFIDNNGTICAVGYLVEQTAGRETAELISERHMYQEILEMNDPAIFEWVQSSGLTLEECAIIQPSYSWDQPDPEGFLSYGVSYRIGDNLYHSLQLYCRNPARHSTYTRFGARFDWLRAGDFSVGFHYSKNVNRRRRGPNKEGGPNLGLTVETFCFNSTWGMNLRPQLELVSAFENVEIGLGYSYAIPIIKENAYGAGRHDISLRLALNISNIHIHLPKREKPQDAKPPDA